MRITVLGCGASSGIPMLGCRCAVCTSANPRNQRLRASILIEQGDTRLLVDTSPDLRQQCLRHDITQISAILFTHAHADHIHGIDDVRSLNYLANAAVPVYADQATLDELRHRFGYAFGSVQANAGWYRPCLEPHVIDTQGWPSFTVGELTVQPFPQVHGKIISLGLRIGDFAYSTDVDHFSETAFETLQGIDTWLVDCLRLEPSPSHANLETTLSWIERVKPRRTVLTHMGHDFEYEAFKRQLPPGIEPAYDDMVIEL